MGSNKDRRQGNEDAFEFGERAEGRRRRADWRDKQRVNAFGDDLDNRRRRRHKALLKGGVLTGLSLDEDEMDDDFDED